MHRATPCIPFDSGLDSLSNYSQQYTSSVFLPINFGLPAEQQQRSAGDNHSYHGSQNLPRRPHTAPSGSEIFRAPSALDVPELSQANLRTMLK